MSQFGVYVGSGGGGGAPIDQIVTDSGTVTPVGGSINLFGETSLIHTTGSGNTATIDLTNGTNGQVIIGGGTTPTWNTLTAGTGISIANAANSITISTAGSVSNSFVTNSGTATPSAGVLNLIGSGSIVTTSGSGNTVDINLSNGTNGQVLIGGGTAPLWANITAGTGISISNGANSIQISNSLPTGLTWIAQSTSTTMTAGTGYITTGVSLVTLTLPATAAVGTMLGVTDAFAGSGGWKIIFGTGQNIALGNSATTSTTGSVASSATFGDSIVLVCVIANTQWNAINMVGNLTFV